MITINENHYSLQKISVPTSYRQGRGLHSAKFKPNASTSYIVDLRENLFFFVAYIPGKNQVHNHLARKRIAWCPIASFSFDHLVSDNSTGWVGAGGTAACHDHLLATYI